MECLRAPEPVALDTLCGHVRSLQRLVVLAVRREAGVDH